MDYKLTDFLPTTKKECELRGWDELDVILFSGDAYVDHPSFGPAILGRMLEANGYRVAIVPQPDWSSASKLSVRNWYSPRHARQSVRASPVATEAAVGLIVCRKPLT